RRRFAGGGGAGDGALLGAAESRAVRHQGRRRARSRRAGRPGGPGCRLRRALRRRPADGGDARVLATRLQMMRADAASPLVTGVALAVAAALLTGAAEVQAIRERAYPPRP